MRTANADNLGHRRWIRSRAAGLAFLAIVTSILVAPEAHSKETYILLRGSGNTYIDVTLERSISIDAGNRRNPFDDSWFQASSNGRYVGYAIHRLPDRKLVAGAVWLRHLDPEGADTRVITVLGNQDTLAAGRYRFTLLSDSRTSFGDPVRSSVLIPTSGTPTLSLEPTKKAAVDVLASAMPLVQGTPAGHWTADVSVGKKSTVLLAGAITGDYAQYTRGSLCLLPRESTSLCDVEEPDSASAWIIPGSAWAYSWGSRIYRQGKVTPDDYQAQINLAVAGYAKRLAAFILIIH